MQKNGIVRTVEKWGIIQDYKTKIRKGDKL